MSKDDMPEKFFEVHLQYPEIEKECRAFTYLAESRGLSLDMKDDWWEWWTMFISGVEFGADPDEFLADNFISDEEEE